MAKKKILFINQEISPYVADTTMSVMGRELPRVMQERNHEIRTFMPKWGTINERRGQLHEVIRLSGMNLIINDTDHPLIIKVASIPTARVQVYFIDNDDYFSKRQMGIDENGVVKILSILDQVESGFNPFPLILAETIHGLDHFAETRRFFGSPMLLEVSPFL